MSMLSELLRKNDPTKSDTARQGLEIAAVAGATYFGGPAAGAALAGTFYSAEQNIKAQRAQRKINALEERRANIRAARERARMLREARVRKANILAQAQAQGISGSSGEIGAQSAIQTQLASNVSFLDQQKQLNQSIFQQKALANAAQGKAQLGQAVSGFASKFVTAESLEKSWQEAVGG